MRRIQNDTSGFNEPAAPAGLPPALRAVYGAVPPVPPDIDVRILDLARTELGTGARGRHSRARVGRPKPSGAVRRVGWTLAAAASVVLAVWMLLPQSRPAADLRAAGGLASETGAGTLEDIDADGRVDMLDALALARGIESGRTPVRTGGRTGGVQSWDVNRDGRVNRADVDAVALRAVRLEGGGS